MPHRIRYAAPAALSPRVRDGIWRFIRQLVTRDREAFERRVSGVEEVWWVERGEDIVAFGAIDALIIPHGGREHGILLTRWAALDPTLRGTNIVQRVGLRAYLRFRARHPLMPVYWMFGASTYTSYLLLSRNHATYWPRPGVAWPEPERALRDAVMALDAEPGWDPQTGVVRRFGATRYREGVVDDDPAMLGRADVRFYHGANPRQADGDTLICMAPLSSASWVGILRHAAQRAWRRGRRSASGGGGFPQQT